jgi:phosphatidylglycerophosphate synthase
MDGQAARVLRCCLPVREGYIVQGVSTATANSQALLGRCPIPATRRASTALAAFTAFRLALIPGVIATFMSRPEVTAACLGAFMVADLYDGILARKFDADGPARRALDSTIDRVAIDACLIGAWGAGAMPALVVIGFLVRDLYCSLLSTWMFLRQRAAINADLPYRGLSFLIAVWALAAPFVTQGTRTSTAIVLLALSGAVAVDLTFGVRQVLGSPHDLAGRVIPAGALRAGRGFTARSR